MELKYLLFWSSLDFFDAKDEKFQIKFDKWQFDQKMGLKRI